jgi:hypothetical protein
MMFAYCDYIAHLVQQGLRHDTEHLLGSVGTTKLHLSESGSFLSTKKTIVLTDKFSKSYRITVEEIS